MISMKVEITALLAGAIVTTVLGYWFWKRQRREKVYVKVGEVKNLFFYPVKSLKGIEVPELECTHLGPKYLGHLDRSFMLISDDGLLVSQRQEPSLTLLSVSVYQDRITITNPDGKTLNLVIKDLLEKVEKTKVIRDCKVHATQTQALDCGDSISEFFQDFLGRKDIRLVCHSAGLSTRRYMGKDPMFFKLAKGNPFTALQDLAPLNIASQASLDDLNTRLEKSVTIHHFRPSVFVHGAPAFDEDNWEHVKFSSGAVVDVLFPCGRCILTTNDPETGIKTNKDPLQTLRQFRIAKDPKVSRALSHSPLFAINCWPQKEGKIFVGNEVYAVIKEGHFACRE